MVLAVVYMLLLLLLLLMLVYGCVAEAVEKKFA